MTSESQRIAIADACGLHIGPTGYDQNSRKVRDYPGCLNAMHEAEKVLTPRQEDEYNKHLFVATAFPNEGYSWHATAAQRAEALLRTLGLWEP